jgi:hypothetical protein
LLKENTEYAILAEKELEGEPMQEAYNRMTEIEKQLDMNRKDILEEAKKLTADIAAEVEKRLEDEL